MPRNQPIQVFAAVLPSLVAVAVGLPAIAQSQTEDNIIWDRAGSSGGSILEEQTDIFDGVKIEDIWDVAQSQIELPDSVEQIGEQVFNGNGTGSIPEDVWSVITTESGLPDYGGETIGDWEQVLSGENNPFDFSSVINRENWGISSFSNSFSGLGVTDDNSANPDADGGSGGWNPFRRISDWLSKTPLARAMSAWRDSIRNKLNGSSFGFFTRSAVVKERDQANLFDQELGRLMASPQLGEAGEQWMQTEATGAMTILTNGLQSAGDAVKIASDAQSLTSTQDVAKAVAEQGGKNAALSAAILQTQTRNQASLLQLQQLTSSAIQLSANNSEGIDEANRRERADRTNALGQSASEFIYIPGVFD